MCGPVRRGARAEVGLKVQKVFGNVNDVFQVYSRGVVSYNILVFNRWGEFIWESAHQSIAWDGKVQGELVQDGVYFYVVSGQDFKGKLFERNGEIYVFK